MKKLASLVLPLALAAFLLAGCGGSASSQSGSASATSAPSGGSSQSVSPSSAPSQASSSSAVSSQEASSSSASAPTSPSAPEQVQSFTGVIADVSMGQMLIELEDGLALTIPYQQADISGLSDTRPGTEVVVAYTGTINGNDTSGITVISISDK